jgi:hypothetical protein
MYAHRLVSVLSIAVMTAAFTSGCDPEDVQLDGAGEAEVSLRPFGSGGVWLNTSSIGSKAFSEFDLAGQLHDGVRLTGVLIKRPNNLFVTATQGEVIDGQLRARVGNTIYTGAGLVGSRWRLLIPEYDYNYDDNDGDDGDDDDDDNGVRNVEIWVSAYTQVAPNEGHYTFQTLNEQGQPTFICDADASGSRAAIPIRNITVNRATGDISARPSTAYLACTSGAIGKAITWGYKPWQRSLHDFEVATRMIRADYCFDGNSWTTTGTALQVRDAYGINDFAYQTEPTEVVWTTTGVACLTQPRSATYAAPQVTCGGKALTTCPTNLTLSTYPNTLFWTKVDTLP